MVDIYYTFVTTHSIHNTKSEPFVNMEFCWKWCINLGSLIIVSIFHSGGGVLIMGQEVYWKSLPSPQICYEPKNALKYIYILNITGIQTTTNREKCFI